jgi:hypothetical protein
VHLPEAKDANRATLLLGSRIARADGDSLKRVQVADFVGVASSAIAESERRMPTAPVAARPSVPSMWSTRTSSIADLARRSEERTHKHRRLTDRCDQDPSERTGTKRRTPEPFSDPGPKLWLCTGHYRHHPELRGMRPTRFELATFGLKDRGASAWGSRISAPM